MKRTNIKETIKNHFFLNPTDNLRVRQIERKLKLPLPSVIRYTKELEKENIIKRNITSEVTFYTADRSSKEFILGKKLFNLKNLHTSSLIDFLKNELSNPVIVVFGSYSKGEDIESSDIDLYIETLSKKSLNLDKYKKKLNRDIQLFIHKNIKEVKNKQLTNNIINGISLNGFLEVLK